MIHYARLAMAELVPSRCWASIAVLFIMLSREKRTVEGIGVGIGSEEHLCGSAAVLTACQAVAELNSSLVQSEEFSAQFFQFFSLCALFSRGLSKDKSPMQRTYL